MSAHHSTLPPPCRAAYFVGRFSALRDHYMSMARDERSAHLRRIYVTTARSFHRQALHWVRETRERLVPDDRWRVYAVRAGWEPSFLAWRKSFSSWLLERWGARP